MARPLTAHGRLRGCIGPSPSELYRLGRDPDAWHDWNRAHGALFRRQHGLPPLKADAEALARETELNRPLPMPPPLDR